MNERHKWKSNDKGFRINARGISCIPCRCKRQLFHQETKTTKEKNIIITNTVIDNRNTKFGSTGRHQSRDDIFKAGNNLQTGSVEMCHTGWGKTQISPEELEERVEKIEIRYWFNEKDIEDINKYKFKLD